MVLVVGNKGAQGTRYECILRYLRRDYAGVDLNSDVDRIDLTKISHVILVTPTDTHFGMIKLLIDLKKPILVEKPVSKKLTELEELKSLVDSKKLDLSMVMQYRHLANPMLSGPSSYDYFRHGKDGLFWDCLQIIGLAKETIDLKEASPVWLCSINGKRLMNGSEMDWAYVQEIAEWFAGYRMPFKEILRIHEKVSTLAGIN